jgi:hypothetical protein
MEKGDNPCQTWTRLLIDHSQAFVFRSLQLSSHIISLKAQMVQASASFLKKLSDPRVRSDWFEQFDLALANREERSFDPLVLYSCHLVQRQTKGIFVKAEGFFEIADDDPDMMDLFQHSIPLIGGIFLRTLPAIGPRAGCVAR